MLLAIIGMLSLFASSASATYGCLDNEGKGVAWWFTLKFPNGYEIAYHDANSPTTKTLRPFERPLDDKDEPVALIRTLRSLLSSQERKHGGDYKASNSPSLNASDSGSAYFMYSDQPDNGNPGRHYGHTKGVVSVDGASSFFIMHSTPNFPSSDGRKGFYFPEGEITYGQTFICLSLESDDIETLAQQLLYTTPYVYKNTLSATLTKKYPSLVKVFDGDWVRDAGTSTAKFSVGGHYFYSLAKNGAWNDDLYEGLVAPHFDSDFLVESWIRGSAEGPYCKKDKYDYEILDVQMMQVHTDSGDNITWSEGQDHAKWAVSLDGNDLCIADINRMTTQRARGGGAICVSDAKLSALLYNSILTSDTC